MNEQIKQRLENLFGREGTIKFIDEWTPKDKGERLDTIVPVILDSIEEVVNQTPEEKRSDLVEQLSKDGSRYDYESKDIIHMPGYSTFDIGAWRWRLPKLKLGVQFAHKLGFEHIIAIDKGSRFFGYAMEKLGKKLYGDKAPKVHYINGGKARKLVLKPGSTSFNDPKEYSKIVRKCLPDVVESLEKGGKLIIVDDTDHSGSTSGAVGGLFNEFYRWELYNKWPYNNWRMLEITEGYDGKDVRRSGLCDMVIDERRVKLYRGDKGRFLDPAKYKGDKKGEVYVPRDMIKDIFSEESPANSIVSRGIKRIYERVIDALADEHLRIFGDKVFVISPTHKCILPEEYCELVGIEPPGKIGHTTKQKYFQDLEEQHRQEIEDGIKMARGK